MVMRRCLLPGFELGAEKFYYLEQEVSLDTEEMKLHLGYSFSATVSVRDLHPCNDKL